MKPEVIYPLSISLLVFLAVFIFAYYGFQSFVAFLLRREQWFQHVLVEQLLLDIDPRVALVLSICGIVVAIAGGYLIGGTWVIAVVLGIVAAVGPVLVVKHLELQRKKRLDAQIVDGVTTLASGVRAGLNLVQAIELLVKNSTAPMQQEFAQLLREYQMGLDLNQAMRNAADRIGSSHYRLLFTAIEMHRLRGGDVGESLDRIADAIREIQRLEGKLDALTSPGRIQAQMMAGISVVLLLISYQANPQGVELLLSEPRGRILLLIVVGLMAAGFAWIRKIVNIDI